jgi:hypothetical protein
VSQVNAPVDIVGAGERTFRRCKDHSFSFVLDATPRDIWTLFWGHRNRVVEYGDVRISMDNDRFMKSAIEKGVRTLRDARR